MVPGFGGISTRFFHSISCPVLGFILARNADLVEKPILILVIILCGTVKAGDIVKDNQVLFFPPMSEDEPLFGDVTHQVHYQVVPLFLAITYDLSDQLVTYEETGPFCERVNGHHWIGGVRVAIPQSLLLDVDVGTGKRCDLVIVHVKAVYDLKISVSG